MSKARLSRNACISLFFCFLMGMKLFFLASPDHESAMMPVYLWPAVIAAIALLFAGHKHSVPKEAWVSLLLAVWFWVVTALNGDRYLVYNLRFLYGIVVTFGLGLPLLMLVEDREKWLMRISAFFALLVAFMALLCLYSWITQTKILSPFNGETIDVRAWRMFFFTVYPNELGSILCIGFFCWLMLSFFYKCRWKKNLCILFSLFPYFACIPCASRTTAILASAALAGAVLLWLLKCLPIRKPLMKGIASIAVSVVVLLLSVAVLMGQVVDLQQVYQGWAKPAQSTVVEETSASTEEQAATTRKDELPEGNTLWSRDISDQSSTFTGRTEIWREAIEYLKERPITLLIGNTDGYVARIPTRLDGFAAIHMQNIWLEMLMQTGILGLLMYGYLMLKALRNAVWVFLDHAQETWKRFLCLILPVVLLYGMMEIYPGVSGNLMDMMGMFLIGAVLTLSPRGNTDKA